jgi:hypothetical protein
MEFGTVNDHRHMEKINFNNYFLTEDLHKAMQRNFEVMLGQTLNQSRIM